MIQAEQKAIRTRDDNFFGLLVILGFLVPPLGGFLLAIVAVCAYGDAWPKRPATTLVGTLGFIALVAILEIGTAAHHDDPPEYFGFAFLGVVVLTCIVGWLEKPRLSAVEKDFAQLETQRATEVKIEVEQPQRRARRDAARPIRTKPAAREVRRLETCPLCGARVSDFMQHAKARHGFIG